MDMKKGLSFAVITLFIGIALAPSITASEPTSNQTVYSDENGTLSGYVKDTSMNPIEGARIQVYFHETYEENCTDSSGYYHVTNVPICYCLKNATASKEGYTTEWVLLAIGENTIYDFVLTPLDTIYVDDNNVNGPWDGTQAHPFQKIQDGIDNTSDGDTIFVYNGTYYENILIKKSITLKGEDVNKTIIVGDGINDIVTINSDWIDISGFNICNTVLEKSKEAIVCIRLNSNFSMIHNNIVYNCSYGIYLNYSSNNEIYKNIIYKHGGISGIFLFQRCNNNTIFGNKIYDFDYWGIYIWNKSNNNVIYDNNLLSNHQTITIDNSRNNIIHNNSINNSGHGVGIWLITGYNNEISSNFIENITYGITLDEASKNNILKNNIIQNNMDGINIFQKSDNNIIMNNIVSNNWNDGIYIAESKDNSVQLNNIINNGQGVNIIRNANRNTIIENNFENNEVNALFHSSYFTMWDKNYWGQPRDTPYLIWGRIGIFNRISLIPWVQFDWHPAKEPYDIAI